jgi:hypothetical protein
MSRSASALNLRIIALCSRYELLIQLNISDCERKGATI